MIIAKKMLNGEILFFGKIMNYSDADYYIYKIIHGIPFDVRRCPDRDYGKNFVEETNKYSEDAGICLNCTKKKCTGSRICYEKRRRVILAGRANSGGKKNVGK